MNFSGKQEWAFILGGSSGMGLAAAKKLAKCGMNIALVHRDRKGSMSRIEQDFAEIKRENVGFISLNENALDSETRTKTVDLLRAEIGPGSIKLLLHSIALGNLKLIAPLNTYNDQDDLKPLATEEDFNQTIFSMGTSLLLWVQDLHRKCLFTKDARVLGLTSEGNQVAWRGYAQVSAAKASLEAIARSIALEFAPYGIRCNILQPGIADTQAFRVIPGSGEMKAKALSRNPFGRITEPKDVANVVALMCTDEASWINGAIIRVDGGEHIVG